MIQMKSILLTGLVGFALTAAMSSKALAVDTPVPPQPTTATHAAPAPDTQNGQGKQHHCPEPAELHKDRQRWKVGKRWKSQSDSFVNKIEKFLGAQWVGVKVGQVICLYQGAAGFTFPVALGRTDPLLILSPRGTNWSENKGGYRNCTSANVHDCVYYEKAKADTKGIYEQLHYRGPVTKEGSEHYQRELAPQIKPKLDVGK